MTATARTPLMRIGAYATCAFALLAWPFMPVATIVVALVCIAIVAARPPANRVERWALQLLATAALLLAVFVAFGTPADSPLL